MKSFSPLFEPGTLQAVNISFDSFQEFVPNDELDSITNQSDESSIFCDVEPNNIFLHPPADLVFPSLNEFASCQEIDLKKDLSVRGAMVSVLSLESSLSKSLPKASKLHDLFLSASFISRFYKQAEELQSTSQMFRKRF